MLRTLRMLKPDLESYEPFRTWWSFLDKVKMGALWSAEGSANQGWFCEANHVSANSVVCVSFPLGGYPSWIFLDKNLTICFHSSRI